MTMDRPLLSLRAMLSNHTLSSALLLTAFASGVFASSASAQGNPLMFTVSSLSGDRDTREEVQRGLNAEDCENGATFTVTAPSTVTITVTQVDLWVATSNVDCSTVEARTAVTPTCFHAGTATFSPTDRTFTVALTEIASVIPAVCNSGSIDGAPVYLYGFTTGNVNELGEVGDQYGSVSVNVDATPPAAPVVSRTTAQGDSQVSVSWEPVAGMRPHYRLFVGGACGANPDGGGADAGTPDVGSLTTIKDTELNVTTATVNPTDDLGLETGESKAVYVAGVDVAGNVGPASAAVCVTRVAVDGFCSVSEEMGEPCPDGCSIGGSSTPSASWIALAMVALFVRRRTR